MDEAIVCATHNCGMLSVLFSLSQLLIYFVPPGAASCNPARKGWKWGREDCLDIAIRSLLFALLRVQLGLTFPNRVHCTAMRGASSLRTSLVMPLVVKNRSDLVDIWLFLDCIGIGVYGEVEQASKPQRCRECSKG